MANRSRQDWDALRDEWVNRRLGGEGLTRKQFATEKGISYRYLCGKSLEWQDELNQREAEIQDQVRDRTAIDHVTMRISILEEREVLRKFFMEQMKRWVEAMDSDETERLEFREIIQLENLLVRMGEVGAGLPKEHHVLHDEAHDVVEHGRREMKNLVGAVVELARWKRDRREAAAKEKAKT